MENSEPLTDAQSRTLSEQHQRELNKWVEGFQQQKRRAVSRLLTMAGQPEFTEAIRELVAGWEEDQPVTGLSVAITGGPGVGKSSLTGRLIEHLRKEGGAVAVLACDPESPLSGGALLGDRIRMADLSRDVGNDEKVMIRSFATAGHQQAVIDSLDLMIPLLHRAGFETVLVETVGAGQGETAVSQVVDYSIVVLQPFTGDELQWEKAGMLEIADVVALNKSDLTGSDRTYSQVQQLLNLPGCKSVPVVRTSAQENSGIPELWERLVGLPKRSMQERSTARLRFLLHEELSRRFHRQQVHLDRLIQDWVEKKLSDQEILSAAFKLFQTTD